MSRKMVVFCVFIAFVLLLPARYAAGEPNIEIFTTYPGISAAAGENIFFPLEIKNNTSSGQVVNLKIVSLPKDWSAVFRGQGREIQQVYVEPNASSSTDLRVNIPETAAAGRHIINVRAESAAGYRDNIALTIVISDARSGGDEMKAQYAELKGSSDATFNFKVNLTNNGGNEQTYSLGARAPDGWQVAFTPSYESQQVASINVKPGETVGLDVKVTPAVSAEAGEYNVMIGAVSPVSQATENLKIIISGTYKMELTTPTERLNASVVAGKEEKVNLVVRNKGGAVLNDINFSSYQPPDWAVTFDPKKVDALKPGESRQITALIKASSKAIAGDYVVSVTASTRETSSTADLRVTVRTSTLWGIVGLIIVLIVIAGVYRVFQIYGRR
ncbi:MAG: NEW3 domain-containing protein [Peptococcaceae bacterium]|nr:NEW3 domain-containing protein [Peptococcaceae bacterium]